MRFLIVGLAVFAVTTMAQAGPKSSSPTSHSVGSRTAAPTSKVKSGLMESSLEYSIGAAGKMTSGDHKKDLQTQQRQLQQLKAQKQNSRVRSCGTC